MTSLPRLHCGCALCVCFPVSPPFSVSHPVWCLQQAEQDFMAKVEAALEANEVDEDQLIEDRRRRRQEILAKHGQAQGQQQAPQPGVYPSARFSICCLGRYHPKPAKELFCPPGSCAGKSEILGSVKSACIFARRLTTVASRRHLLYVCLLSLKCLPSSKPAFLWVIN